MLLSRDVLLKHDAGATLCTATLPSVSQRGERVGRHLDGTAPDMRSEYSRMRDTTLFTSPRRICPPDAAKPPSRTPAGRRE